MCFYSKDCDGNQILLRLPSTNCVQCDQLVSTWGSSWQSNQSTASESHNHYSFSISERQVLLERQCRRYRARGKTLLRWHKALVLSILLEVYDLRSTNTPQHSLFVLICDGMSLQSSRKSWLPFQMSLSSPTLSSMVCDGCAMLVAVASSSWSPRYLCVQPETSSHQ